MTEVPHNKQGMASVVALVNFGEIIPETDDDVVRVDSALPIDNVRRWTERKTLIWRFVSLNRLYFTHCLILRNRCPKQSFKHLWMICHSVNAIPISTPSNATYMKNISPLKMTSFFP